MSIEKPEHRTRSQPIIRTFVFILIGFLVYHVLLTPIFMLISEAGLSVLRAPIFEEAFKVLVAAKLLTFDSRFTRALLVGSAVGAGEMIINILVNYDEMMADIASAFPDLSTWAIYMGIGLGILAKLALATVGHFFFVYAAALIARGWNFFTFLVAAIIHYAINALILA